MPIPDYQTLMLPLLTFLKDQKERTIAESIEHLSDLFSLSTGERKELVPSARRGTETLIRNRVGWARAYLTKAGLIESPRRGHCRISQRGLAVLKENPTKIDVKYLQRFPEFVEFHSRRLRK